MNCLVPLLYFIFSPIPYWIRFLKSCSRCQREIIAAAIKENGFSEVSSIFLFYNTVIISLALSLKGNLGDCCTNLNQFHPGSERVSRNCFSRNFYMQEQLLFFDGKWDYPIVIILLFLH